MLHRTVAKDSGLSARTQRVGSLPRRAAAPRMRRISVRAEASDVAEEKDQKAELSELLNRPYKYGFKSTIEQDIIPKARIRLKNANEHRFLCLYRTKKTLSHRWAPCARLRLLWRIVAGASSLFPRPLPTVAPPPAHERNGSQLW